MTTPNNGTHEATPEDITETTPDAAPENAPDAIPDDEDRLVKLLHFVGLTLPEARAGLRYLRHVGGTPQNGLLALYALLLTNSKLPAELAWENAGLIINAWVDTKSIYSTYDYANRYRALAPRLQIVAGGLTQLNQARQTLSDKAIALALELADIEGEFRDLADRAEGDDATAMLLAWAEEVAAYNRIINGQGARLISEAGHLWESHATHLTHLWEDISDEEPPNFMADVITPAPTDYAERPNQE